MKRIFMYVFLSSLLILMLGSCDFLDSDFLDDDQEEETQSDNDTDDQQEESQAVQVTVNPLNLFFIEQSDRETSINSSTRPSVDMKFVSPDDFGADSYTLQYSSDGESGWSNYQYYGEDLTTGQGASDNFSIRPDGDYWYRLQINGGTNDGHFSNKMQASLSAVNTYFSNWSLDESVYNTGVIAPSVGYGLEASFIVKKLDDNSFVENGLSYEWYRVNPNDYDDMEQISGQSGLTYTTTSDDRGYTILVRSVGDGTNVGGMLQILSSNVVE